MLFTVIYSCIQLIDNPVLPSEFMNNVIFKYYNINKYKINIIEMITFLIALKEFLVKHFIHSSKTSIKTYN